MAPIRLGVIGLSANGGWASLALIPPIFDPLLADKYVLTALATSSEASAKKAVEKFSELAKRPVKGYWGKNGAVEIANDPEVDMVVVGVKIIDHYEAIRPAIEAGKDVFVEWAPGRNLEETVRIAEAVKAKGVRSLVGTQAPYGVAVNKVKEIIESGKIGKVLSTTLSGVTPHGFPYFGRTAIPSSAYTADINNGTTMLTVPVGHILSVLRHVLGGDVSEVSAFGAIRHPEAAIIDTATNKPTGETTQKTSHDQIIFAGTLAGKHEGAVVHIHYQGGGSRSHFSWLIEGDEGYILVRPTAENAATDVLISMHEEDVLLNGELVPLELTEVDKKLGNTGKAWLEFAKGDKGRYVDLEQAVSIYRVVDAALTSIVEGRRILVQ